MRKQLMIMELKESNWQVYVDYGLFEVFMVSASHFKSKERLNIPIQNARAIVIADKEAVPKKLVSELIKINNKCLLQTEEQVKLSNKLTKYNLSLPAGALTAGAFLTFLYQEYSKQKKLNRRDFLKSTAIKSLILLACGGGTSIAKWSDNKLKKELGTVKDGLNLMKIHAIGRHFLFEEGFKPLIYVVSRDKSALPYFAKDPEKAKALAERIKSIFSDYNKVREVFPTEKRIVLEEMELMFKPKRKQVEPKYIARKEPVSRRNFLALQTNPKTIAHRA
ncbi:MAG: hypothetical protein ABH821_04170 [archaeon]